MAGISSVQANLSAEFKWSLGNSLTGAAYNQVQNSGDIRKSVAFSNTAGNTASGGCDEVFSFQQAIGAGAIATINLNTMTNLLQQTSVAIARIKGVLFRLLSGTDDSTISPTPTATSACVVTNNPPSTAAMTVPCQLDFGNGGSGLTLALTGTGAVTAVAIGVAGTGYPKSSTFLVAPVQAAGSGCCVAVTTNSSGVPTTVALVVGAGGAGYTAATVPTVVLGHHFLYTGGAGLYVDGQANGICVVSATAANIAIVNLDASNAITVECSFLATT